MELHPGAAAIDCEDCKQWIYDLETGKRALVRVGPDRGERPQPRPPGVPTPCGECPKKNPENAAQIKLTPKNRQTLDLWRRARATQFQCVPEHLRSDPILARNFAELDWVTQYVAEQRQMRMMQMLTLQAMGNKHG